MSGPYTYRVPPSFPKCGRLEPNQVSQGDLAPLCMCAGCGHSWTKGGELIEQPRRYTFGVDTAGGESYSTIVVAQYLPDGKIHIVSEQRFREASDELRHKLQEQVAQRMWKILTQGTFKPEEP